MKRELTILVFVNFLIWIVCSNIMLPADIEIEFKITDTRMLLWSLWSLLSIWGLLFFNIYCFYDWAMKEFISRNVKKNWLAILLVSTIFSGGICSLIYYILVIEMGYGLKTVDSE